MLDGQWALKQDHAYFYQIQMQLFICKKAMQKEVVCDFIVWTSKDTVIQRISLDEAFIQMKLDVLQHFFINAILPEVIGKWYSRKPIADDKGIVTEPRNTDTTSSEEKENEDYTKSWCYCCQPTYGNMILCDNQSCTIQWFHFDCLSIRAPPKGKW